MALAIVNDRKLWRQRAYFQCASYGHLDSASRGAAFLAHFIQPGDRGAPSSANASPLRRAPVSSFRRRGPGRENNCRYSAHSIHAHRLITYGFLFLVVVRAFCAFLGGSGTRFPAIFKPFSCMPKIVTDLASILALKRAVLNAY